MRGPVTFALWRALVVLLVLANIAFFAWTRGWLHSSLGTKPFDEREPQRLQRQIQPDAVELRSAAVPASGAARAPSSATATATATATARSGSGAVKTAPDLVASEAAASEAASAAAAASAVAMAAASAAAMADKPPIACLETGPVNEATVAALGRELTGMGVPAGGWSASAAARLGWWVYMGRYADDALTSRKSEELRRINVRHERARAPADLVPGLVLGQYATRESAEADLARLGGRGIRTARVIEVPAAPALQTVKLTTNDAALLTRLRTWRSAALGGQPLGVCATAVGTAASEPAKR